MIKAQAICDLLNQLNAADPIAIRSIVEHRVPLDISACGDIPVVIGGDDTLGILGIINGFVPDDDDQVIASIVKDDGTIEGFRVQKSNFVAVR